ILRVVDQNDMPRLVRSSQAVKPRKHQLSAVGFDADGSQVSRGDQVQELEGEVSMPASDTPMESISHAALGGPSSVARAPLCKFTARTRLSNRPKSPRTMACLPPTLKRLF